MKQKETILDSFPVELADYQEYKLATFLVCVCGEPDLRGRVIPADAAERCHASMVGFPIVAKLVYNAAGEPVDFAGHEAYTSVDRNGRKTMHFGTQPVGSVIRSWIEDRTVPGRDQPRRCIMIQAKLWSARYPEYFRVLDRLWASGQVKSSWELVVLRESASPAGRVLEEFAFVGNALLGSRVAGAVPGAGICEYAQRDDASERELAAALGRDVAGKTEHREEKTEMTEPGETPQDHAKPESLSLEDALREAQEKIRDLEEQIKHLLPYKEAADQAERERIKRETAQAKPSAADSSPRWNLRSEETEVDHKTFMHFLLFRNTTK